MRGFAMVAPTRGLVTSARTRETVVATMLMLQISQCISHAMPMKVVQRGSYAALFLGLMTTPGGAFPDRISCARRV
jgi:hypothetical protein